MDWNKPEKPYRSELNFFILNIIFGKFIKQNIFWSWYATEVYYRKVLFVCLFNNRAGSMFSHPQQNHDFCYNCFRNPPMLRNYVEWEQQQPFMLWGILSHYIKSLIGELNPKTRYLQLFTFWPYKLWLIYRKV